MQASAAGSALTTRDAGASSKVADEGQGGGVMVVEGRTYGGGDAVVGVGRVQDGGDDGCTVRDCVNDYTCHFPVMTSRDVVSHRQVLVLPLVVVGAGT